MEQHKYVRYTAVVLDGKSKDKLYKVFAGKIPEGWKIIADHMTINLGDIKTIPENEKYLNTKIFLSVNDFAADNMVMAIGVTPTNANIKSTNEKTHITIAVNEKNGAKPKMSNYLKDWENFKRPFLLSGIVTEVE